MIAIVDYDMGNLRSVSKALEHVGASVRVTSDPSEVASAEKLVLPGVGAFPAAMRELCARGLVEPIKRVIAEGRPYLGICLGLQLLFDDSEEGAGAKGLGVLAGQVRKFTTASEPRLKIPHMGWNQVLGQRATAAGAACPLLEGISDGSYFYFVHSYYAQPADRPVVVLTTEYGVPFAAMVWKDRLFATQFHPEKSQALGLKLLENFVKL